MGDMHKLQHNHDIDPFFPPLGTPARLNAEASLARLPPDYIDSEAPGPTTSNSVPVLGTRGHGERPRSLPRESIAGHMYPSPTRSPSPSRRRLAGLRRGGRAARRRLSATVYAVHSGSGCTGRARGPPLPRGLGDWDKRQWEDPRRRAPDLVQSARQEPEI
jgi:hypothetical protein